MILWLDLETLSFVPINYGTFAYAKGAKVLLVAYAIDGGPVMVVAFNAEELQALIDQADKVVIHNAQFDVTVLRENGVEVPLDKLIDTMALAMLHGLPGSLDKLSEIFRLETPKMKEGRRLVRMFCVPDKKGHVHTAETKPQDWETFKQYAAMDVAAMRELHSKLPKWNWNSFEQALWILDQKINARGIMIDVELAEAALRAVTTAQEQLAEKAARLTDGAVPSTTQRDALLSYIGEAYGVEPDDLRAGTVEKLLEGDLPPDLVELLQVRLQATTSSTAKYNTALNAATDGRLRGTLQYSGASRTARWAGRLVQLQNLPRPTLKQGEIDLGIEALKGGYADLLFDNVMELASSAIRGLLIAPLGKKLVIADLSSIEGRALAWLAGEQWKVEAYAAGADLYVLTYAKTFNVSPESVTKDQRQIGKILELAMGYGGGAGAFATFAAGYGTDLEAMAEKAWPILPRSILEEAEKAWDWTKEQGRPTQGLSQKVWVVCDSFKRQWRRANPEITSFWRDVEDGVREAIEDNGSTAEVRKVKVLRSGAWLRIVLPSGRSLSYPAPRVEDGVISFMGVNQFSRRWERLTTFGGRLVENITQATARDILACGLVNAEAAGLNPVLHIHDEILCEADDKPEFSAELLADCMSRTPGWAAGLPLSAEGFECARYRK